MKKRQAELYDVNKDDANFLGDQSMQEKAKTYSGMGLGGDKKSSSTSSSSAGSDTLDSQGNVKKGKPTMYNEDQSEFNNNPRPLGLCVGMKVE